MSAQSQNANINYRQKLWNIFRFCLWTVILTGILLLCHAVSADWKNISNGIFNL